VRRKRIRRELAALGLPPHQPTEESRHQVRILAFNRTAEAVIAEIIGVDITVLRYWYAKELDHSEIQILAQAAANMIALAGQKADLSVAYRANELILRTRLPAWREPKPVEADPGGEAKPAVSLTLKEVERELARLRKPDDGPADGAPPPREDPVPGQGKPH
jgi:hypothetical protein